MFNEIFYSNTLYLVTYSSRGVANLSTVVAAFVSEIDANIYAENWNKSLGWEAHKVTRQVIG
jgi:hypothetical protein